MPGQTWPHLSLQHVSPSSHIKIRLLLLTASSRMSSLRLGAHAPAVSSSRSTSRRVKPFLPHPAGRVQQLVPRAAAPEADAEEGDFSFSLSDAKKGNDYSPSDVQAALDYYEGEPVSAPSYNEEFVGNPLGIEDASFFDDIDNNEAYEADEYIVAGIPEAAPKKRRGGRREVGPGP